MISKGERTELKSVVRNQFKVLRAEVEQRELEMLSNVEQEIIERYADDDQNWAVVTHLIHEATMACNRAINDALAEHGYQVKSGTERMWVTTPAIRKPEEDRQQLRQLGHSRIRAQGKQARLSLDRQEADLLRTLAVGAIESDEAKAFLAAIPTVGELVPGTRLAELEASLDPRDGPEDIGGR